MEILNALGAENAHSVIGASTKDSAASAPRKPRRALGDITNAGAKRSQRGPSLKPTIGPRLDPPLAEKTAAAASDIEHSFTCGAGVDYVRDVGLEVSVLVGSVLAAPCKLSGVGCMPKAELLPALLQEPIEVLGGGVLEINGWAQDHEGEQDMISFEIDIDSVTFA